MSAYHVSFFKNLVSSDGHPFKCLQQRIDVSDAESAAEATESASRAFENALRMSVEPPCGFDRGSIDLLRGPQLCSGIGRLFLASAFSIKTDPLAHKLLGQQLFHENIIAGCIRPRCRGAAAPPQRTTRQTRVGLMQVKEDGEDCRKEITN